MISAGLPASEVRLVWIVVAAYCAGALLAIAAAHRAKARERTFWLVTGIILVLLAINRQFNLQGDLAEAGRMLARSEGWYGSRHVPQLLLVLSLAAGSAVLEAFLWRALRNASASVKAAAVGLLGLVAFILIRAVSLHDIDYWVTIHVAGIRSGWWIELLGITAIAASAAIYSVRSAASPGSSRAGPEARPRPSRR